MKHDRTRLMWNAKKKLYKRTRIDIIVASNWMESRVKQSPLLQDHRVHVVPFGVDTTVFSPQDKVYARKRLGIETHTTVLGFRSSDFPTKGLSILKSALFALNTQQPSTLLTLDQRGLVGDLAGKFKIIECGWVQDGLALRDIYSAMDIFVIPSLAESFCLMAVEAMACGVPVISFDSTPIPELFSQERGGIAVPYANAVELEVAIRSLAENQQRRNELGKAARLRAVTCYGFQEHVNRVLEVYTEVENRRKAKSQ